MSIGTCPACGAPRASTDEVCPSCGAPADRPVTEQDAAALPATAPPRRRWGTVVILVALAGALFVWNSTRNDEESAVVDTPVVIDDVEVGSAATAAGCQQPLLLPSEGAEHVDPGANVTYRTSPPASGKHTITSATGVHQVPVAYVNAMHNLEHGHVLLFYRPGVSADVIAALNRVARENSSIVIAAPDPQMRPEIAMTAWQRQVRCTAPPGTYEGDEIERVARLFLDRFKGKGPEGLLPGTPAAGT